MQIFNIIVETVFTATVFLSKNRIRGAQVKKLILATIPAIITVGRLRFSLQLTKDLLRLTLRPFQRSALAPAQAIKRSALAPALAM